MRLWRKDPAFAGGKYLAMRRDGTIPAWASMLFAAPDPAAPAALKAYADKAAGLGYDPQFVADVRELAAEWEAEQAAGLHPKSDADAPPHRTDNPAVIAMMHGSPVFDRLLELYTLVADQADDDLVDDCPAKLTPRMTAAVAAVKAAIAARPRAAAGA